MVRAFVALKTSKNAPDGLLKVVRGLPDGYYMTVWRLRRLGENRSQSNMFLESSSFF